MSNKSLCDTFFVFTFLPDEKIEHQNKKSSNHNFAAETSEITYMPVLHFTIG